MLEENSLKEVNTESESQEEGYCNNGGKNYGSLDKNDDSRGCEEQ